MANNNEDDEDVNPDDIEMDWDHVQRLIQNDQDRTRMSDEVIGAIFDSLTTSSKSTRKHTFLSRQQFGIFLKEAASRTNLMVPDQMIEAAVTSLIGDDDNDSTKKNMKKKSITKEDFLNIFKNNPELYFVFDSSDETTQRQNAARVPITSTEIQAGRSGEIQTFDISPMKILQHGEGWRNRHNFRIWMTIWLVANYAMFHLGTTKVSDQDVEVMGKSAYSTHGASVALNFNCFFLMLLISRHWVTFVRNLKCSRRLLPPMDSVTLIHRMMGAAFGIWMIVHVVGGFMDISSMVNQENPLAWAAISYVKGWASDEELQLLGEFQYSNGTDTSVVPKLAQIAPSKSEKWSLFLSEMQTITGIVMAALVLMAYVVIPLKSKYYNLFWYMHHLLLSMLILMVIHGMGNTFDNFTTLYWQIVPFAFYIIPRILREFNCTSVKILMVKIYGDVLELRLEKPASKCFWHQSRLKAGMYCNINIPALSILEWHPFTMSSSPDTNYLGFHIKCTGDWTKRALKVMEPFEAKMNLPESGDHSNQGLPPDAGELPIVRIEGPIGAPAQLYSDHEVVVLIGAGIGITPMTSVVEEILRNPGSIKHVFFYWAARDASSFEWFRGLMEQVYQKQKTSQSQVFLEVRQFLTSAKQDDRDLGSVLLYHAANTIHSKTDLDIVLGHHAKEPVQIGRPKWDTELGRIKSTCQQQYGRNLCGIFLCGPDGMAKDLWNATEKQKDSTFSFDFNKETF